MAESSRARDRCLERDEGGVTLRFTRLSARMSMSSGGEVANTFAFRCRGGGVLGLPRLMLSRKLNGVLISVVIHGLIARSKSARYSSKFEA